MDTTTVNLIADKFTQAWGQVAPTLGMGFEEYCEYILFTEGMGALVGCGVFIVFAALTVFSFIMGKNTDVEEWLYIGFIAGFIALSGGAITLVEIYEFVMAYNFPEIYTIEHIIQMAK
jgi:hypothetical protein